MKFAFVKEVERVAKDPIYWVRREASYTLGALAKVIPIEIVVSSLVSTVVFGYAGRFLMLGHPCVVAPTRDPVSGRNLACSTLSALCTACNFGQIVI